MKTNLNQFLKKYKADQQLSLETSAKIINSAINEIYEKIVDRTPVGDPSLWNWPSHKNYNPGTLKASWQLSFNGVQRNLLGQFASTEQTIANNGLSFKLGSKSKGSVVISNPQPYAQRVESGWSTQAPQGMMRITIAEYSSVLNQKSAKYRIK